MTFSLLEIQAVEPVLEKETFSRTYSNLFVVHKKYGNRKEVLDLKDLNRCVKEEYFSTDAL